MKKEIQKLRKENTILFTATIILFILFLSVFFLSVFPLQTNSNKNTNTHANTNTETQQIQTNEKQISESAVLLNVPAIDRKGNGVSVVLSVEAEKGTGKTLIDIGSLYFFTDTQESILIAKKVASDYTGLNLNDYDLIYDIYAEADSIGGPSAGAALTIATIAALQNLKLEEDVMITGSILSNGGIGDVSSISAKALAAKQIGASIFLVPEEQSKEISYETQRKCETKNYREICTIDKIPVEVSIEDLVGIKVIEVATIQEALSYFVK
ncbi:MAG: hypothetical protein KJ767_02170 [Nanoarchaeota archaeon]|nr:hypothetical protein [Nanoarchaeota archaeon]